MDWRSSESRQIAQASRFACCEVVGPVIVMLKLQLVLSLRKQECCCAGETSHPMPSA